MYYEKGGVCGTPRALLYVTMIVCYVIWTLLSYTHSRSLAISRGFE
jgi:hypothetical protein